MASALPVPAPDGGVITHSNKDAAVTAEAGLADGGGATGQRQRGASGGTAVTLVRGKAGAQQEQHHFSKWMPPGALGQGWAIIIFIFFNYF